MSIWQISESGTEVVLDDQGRGEVTFTVKNTGDAQDRSVLTIAAVDGAADSWFTVEEPQRLVPPQDSAAYLCRIQVPAGTAAGTYAMQAVAYSADRDPGESSTTSRRVALTVKPSTPPPPPRPWWAFVLAAVVVLAVIGVVLWLVLDGDDGLANEEPPAIDGTPEVLQVLTASPGTWSEAPEDLTFAFQWQRCDDAGGECEAIEGALLQTYQAGADDEGATLRVEVTATFGSDETASAVSDPTGAVAPHVEPPVAVPDVVGTPLVAARNLLAQSFQVVHLTAGPVANDCNPVIESQAPPPGTMLDAGEQVTISSRPPGGLLILCLDLRIPILVEDLIQFEVDDLVESP